MFKRKKRFKTMLDVDNKPLAIYGIRYKPKEIYLSIQEMAKIIANVLEEIGYKKGDPKDLNVFKDKDDIASWAKESVGLSVKEGLITGMDNAIVAPNEKATRAQAAVMLHRLYNLIMN